MIVSCGVEGQLTSEAGICMYSDIKALSSKGRRLKPNHTIWLQPYFCISVWMCNGNDTSILVLMFC